MALTSQNGKGTPAREPGGNDQFVSGRSVAVTGQNSCPPAGRYLAVCGQSLVTAAVMCATTPARELGLVGYGVLAPDASADLVVLDANLAVVHTYVGGHLVYARNTAAPAAV